MSRFIKMLKSIRGEYRIHTEFETMEKLLQSGHTFTSIANLINKSGFRKERMTGETVETLLKFHRDTGIKNFPVYVFREIVHYLQVQYYKLIAYVNSKYVSMDEYDAVTDQLISLKKAGQLQMDEVEYAKIVDRRYTHTYVYRHELDAVKKIPEEITHHDK